MNDDIVTRLREVATAAPRLVPEAAEAADEIERLRAVLDAIDALHRGMYHCNECDFEWPCPTHLLIHPMEADRG